MVSQSTNSSPTIDSVLSPDLYDIIYTINNGAIQVYSTGQKDFTTLEPGRGYLIGYKPDKEAAPIIIFGPPLTNTDINLVKGINFVGFNGKAETPVESALVTVMDSVTKVITVDNGIWQTFEKGSAGNSLLTLKPGKGYLIYVTGNVTWKLPTD
ncbi:MAG: hypothetical protein HQK60_06875 [Deltaproteobacteria bacterium]|nr:hypothetical protein [Deltaproteobacteria bacterium]